VAQVAQAVGATANSFPNDDAVANAAQFRRQNNGIVAALLSKALPLETLHVEEQLVRPTTPKKVSVQSQYGYNCNKLSIKYHAVLEYTTDTA
jgi:hypothetical protein